MAQAEVHQRSQQHRNALPMAAKRSLPSKATDAMTTGALTT